MGLSTGAYGVLLLLGAVLAGLYWAFNWLLTVPPAFPPAAQRLARAGFAGAAVLWLLGAIGLLSTTNVFRLQ